MSSGRRGFGRRTTESDESFDRAVEDYAASLTWRMVVACGKLWCGIAVASSAWWVPALAGWITHIRPQ